MLGRIVGYVRSWRICGPELVEYAIIFIQLSQTSKHCTAYLLVESYKYAKQVDPQDSPNFVMLRCAVAVGNTLYAKGPMNGIKKAPYPYDSVRPLCFSRLA